VYEKQKISFVGKNLAIRNQRNFSQNMMPAPSFVREKNWVINALVCAF